MKLTLPQRISVWVTAHLPRVLVSDTERVGLSLAFIAVGLTSLERINMPATYYSTGAVNIVMWSLTLVFGGIFTIWGMATGARATERFGLVLSTWGCLVYGSAALAGATTRGGWIIGIMFLCLAVIKLLRLIVSSAAQARELQQLQRQEPEE